jgi:hypothetical protein
MHLGTVVGRQDDKSVITDDLTLSVQTVTKTPTQQKIQYFPDGIHKHNGISNFFDTGGM